MPKMYLKQPGFTYSSCATVTKNQRRLELATRELAEELHKPIVRKFKKRKVHSLFIDDIWGVDLADMQLISKFNKGICCLLGVIDIFSKYAWVIPLKKQKRHYNY